MPKDNDPRNYFNFWAQQAPQPLLYQNRAQDAKNFVKELPGKLSWQDIITGHIPKNVTETTGCLTVFTLYNLFKPDKSGRSRGNQMADLETPDNVFFLNYGSGSITENYPNREKLLHFSVVFGIDPNVLLKEFFYRALSRANPFELTLEWVFQKIIRTRGPHKQNMEDFEVLYIQVREILDSKKPNDTTVSAEQSSERDEQGRPRNESSFEVSSIIHGRFESLLMDENADDTRFLEAVSENAHRFRYHSRGLEDAYFEQKNFIEQTFKDNRRLFPSGHRALSTLLYDTFGHAAGWGEKKSFQNRLSFIDKTHKRQPTRELLILVYLLAQCAHDEFSAEEPLNTYLIDLGLPQLNDNVLFDRAVHRIISYKRDPNDPRPYDKLLGLVQTYQEAYESKAHDKDDKHLLDCDFMSLWNDDRTIILLDDG